jgi:NADPH:quinone reductase-like Zn-dependent oxidoreductase
VATGTSEDTERLRALGADTVVDHTGSPVADQVRAAYRHGVDALVNLAGYTAADVPLDAVRAGGRVSTTTTSAPDAETLTAHGLTGTSIITGPVRDVIARLAEQVAAGSLTVDVGAVLTLEQATDGLATIGLGNARGKIVVMISD